MAQDPVLDPVLAFPVTRAEALDRLAAFAPISGDAYARNRNRDRGDGNHDAVSRLSAALCRRTIGEHEVLQSVLARHGTAAESFVSEVFWRGYFRGYLEARPQIWTQYCAALDHADARIATDDALAARHLAAERGATGIDCFDHWMGELAATGYLHNWARMQVASIWIFTLGLPWETGARHFLRHLIDGDAASNTLSWRWVAGLHTRGKAYLADAERIRWMTEGRFDPRGLATRARIPDLPPPAPPGPWRAAATIDPALPSLVWIHPGDAALETCTLPRDLSVTAVAALDDGREPGLAAIADRRAIDDALDRAACAWRVPAPRVADPETLVARARDSGARQIVTAYVPTGPAHDTLVAMRAAARKAGLALGEHLRDWDAACWPHATRGFFALRAVIPDLLAQAGLGQGDVRR